MNKSQDHYDRTEKEFCRTPVLQGRLNGKKERNMNSLVHLSKILTNNPTQGQISPRNFPSLTSLNNNQFQRTIYNSVNGSVSTLRQTATVITSKKPQTSSQKHRMNNSQMIISDFNRSSQNNSVNNTSQQIPSENYKTILNDFLRISGYSEKFEIDLEGLQGAIKEILQVNERLESENRSFKKDTQRHSKMLEFLQISNKQKDTFFQQMVEQNICIKGELDELKLQKTQLKEIKMIKDLKQPIIISSPQRKRLTMINQNAHINNTTDNQKPVIDKSDNKSQLIKQKSQKWVQMKQILEDHNILQTNSSDTNQRSSSKKRTLILNTSNNIQNVVGQQTPLSTLSGYTPQNTSYNSKLSKIFKTNRSSIPTIGVDSQEKKNLRPQFIQHSTDHAFYASALDLDINDNEIRDFYQEGKYIKFLKGHFSDESNMQKLIYNLEGQTFKYFYESVNSLLSNQQVGMNLILKMKQHKMNISEVFDTLSQETIKILSCDKAQIYLLEEKSNLFWTKGNKNEMIKLPLEASGFCGHVAKEGQLINVLDAQLDDRFDKSIDAKTNYRTKSVLCAPIFDSKQNNRVMGVIQVINKENQSFFTKDDEGILKVISLLSENIFKNSVFNDERAEFYNSLRALYTFSIEVIKAASIQELFETSYAFLQRSLNIPMCKIILFDKQLQKFYTFLSGQKVIYDTTEGIVGKVFNTQTLAENSNISEHTDFNRIIDIETQLPVVTIPILQAPNLQKDNKATPFSIEDFIHFEMECSGVLQVINSRGIHSLLISSDKDQKQNLKNYETLQRFCKLFSSALLRLL